MSTLLHDDHRPNVRLYMKIFAALMVLTVITVAISKVHLPRPQGIALGLCVAAVKAALVAGIFMHLWGEGKLVHKLLYITFAFAAILVLPIIDAALTQSRLTHPMPVADQHPTAHDSGHLEAH